MYFLPKPQLKMLNVAYVFLMCYYIMPALAVCMCKDANQWKVAETIK